MSAAHRLWPEADLLLHRSLAGRRSSDWRSGHGATDQRGGGHNGGQCRQASQPVRVPVQALA